MGVRELFGIYRRVIGFIEREAIIIDVRDTELYKNGHVDGARNIPLQDVPAHLKDIKSWGKPVIVCGARKKFISQVTIVLRQEGVDVLNGGKWSDVNRVVKRS